MKTSGHDPTYTNGFDHDKPLTFIDPITWHGKRVPERQWLVPDWIPMKTVTGLYGDGGIGKSLLAQQLLTATATNKNWLGLLTRSVKAIGVFCEDPEEELHIRQADINKLYNCDFSDLENVRYLPRFGEDNLLMTFTRSVGELTPFYHRLVEMARDFGSELIGIDTVADTFGGNENDRSQVRQYVQLVLGGLARAINGAVIALAHPSRTGINSGSGDGGSTGWSNTFRSRLYFQSPKQQEGDPDPDPLERVLSRMKANYAARNEALSLKWHQGVFVRPDDDAGILGTIKRRTVERVFLDQLAAIRGEGRHVSEKDRASNYAPVVFSQRKDREGFRRDDFRRAMETLFTEQKIRVAAYKGSNRTPSEEIVSV